MDPQHGALPANRGPKASLKLTKSQNHCSLYSLFAKDSTVARVYILPLRFCLQKSQLRTSKKLRCHYPTFSSHDRAKNWLLASDTPAIDKQRHFSTVRDETSFCARTSYFVMRIRATKAPDVRRENGIYGSGTRVTIRSWPFLHVHYCSPRWLQLLYKVACPLNSSGFAGSSTKRSISLDPSAQSIGYSLRLN